MSDVDQKIEQAKIIMNENVAGNVDPEELAMRLNISYSWFHRVFKEYTGYAPAKYFQELKLRKAKQLLVGTSQSVKEILFFLGFLYVNSNDFGAEDYSYESWHKAARETYVVV